jgi:hypothetical protein
MAFDFGQTFGFQSKRPAAEKFDPYAEIRPLLRQTAVQGFPEIAQMGGDIFRTQIAPGIQEIYQAKRGLGAGSTPEVAALGQAGAGLAQNLALQNLQTRLRALGLFAGTGLQGQFFQPTSTGQNIWAMLGPLLAQAAGGAAYGMAGG